jgi:hypothetical protein
MLAKRIKKTLPSGQPMIGMELRALFASYSFVLTVVA